MAQNSINSLRGANIQSSTPQIGPQTALAPPQLNGLKMNTQVQNMQNQGAATAQAVNTAANNPGNKYYSKGGPVPHARIVRGQPALTEHPNGVPITGTVPQMQPVQAPIQAAGGGSISPPPSKPQIEDNMAKTSFDPDNIRTLEKAVSTTPALGSAKSSAKQSANQGDSTEQMLRDYQSPQGQKYLQDRAKMTTEGATNPKMAKGGDVHGAIKNMPLKDVIKLLASHPDVGGMGAANAGSPMQGQDMRAGGAIGGQNDPDATPKPQANMKSEARSHGKGLLDMNADVQTYKMGGAVASTGTSESEVQENRVSGLLGKTPSSKAPNVKLAGGGGLEGGQEEEDSITSYDPDGTPVIQNADGTTQNGDINQLLDRPESASTLGTGQTPINGVSKNAANAPAPPQTAENTTNMAKGGVEAPPPGSLSKEVADDIPAQLSQGEFVFSADAVRYYGLRLLNGMMEHARQSLTAMENEGNIRSPGDGKNPANTDGQFMQDQKPNMSAYGDEGQNQDADDDDDVTGILRECMGGGIGEDSSLAKGGAMYKKEQNPNGNDNTVSSHPKGGSTLLDYAKGGIVSSTMANLTPKKNEGLIPMGKSKDMAPKLANMSTIKAPTVKAPKLKVKEGGAIKQDVNQQRDINQTQSYIG